MKSVYGISGMIVFAMVLLSQPAHAGVTDAENANSVVSAETAEAKLAVMGGDQAKLCNQAEKKLAEEKAKGNMHNPELEQQMDFYCKQSFTSEHARNETATDSDVGQAAERSSFQPQSDGFSKAEGADTSKLYKSNDSLNGVKMASVKVDNSASKADLSQGTVATSDRETSMGYMKQVGGDVVGSAKVNGQATTVTAHEVAFSSNMLNSKSLDTYSVSNFDDSGKTVVGLASKAGAINMANSYQPTVIPLGQQITFDSQAYLKNGTITAGNANSGYGMRTTTVKGQTVTRPHNGTDYTGKMLDGNRNTDILASGSGKVVEAKCVSGGYGCSVVIDHGNGVYTRYGHLDSMNVKVGDTVAQGSQIAVMGNTGRSQATHLHYEVLNGGTAGSNGIATIGTTSTYNQQVASKFGYDAAAPTAVVVNGNGTNGNATNGNGTTTQIATNSGLGSTVANMLSGALGTTTGGSSDLINQLASLMGGGSSSGSGSSGSSGSGSTLYDTDEDEDRKVKDIVVSVDRLGNTTQTVTYDDGYSETVVVQTVVASNLTVGGMETLLGDLLGTSQSSSVMAAIRSLCGASLASGADADMLKISQCQQTPA